MKKDLSEIIPIIKKATGFKDEHYNDNMAKFAHTDGRQFYITKTRYGSITIEYDNLRSIKIIELPSYLLYNISEHIKQTTKGKCEIGDDFIECKASVELPTLSSNKIINAINNLNKQTSDDLEQSAKDITFLRFQNVASKMKEFEKKDKN